MGAPAPATRQLDSGTVWTTPREFFDGVERLFGPFDLDAAANHENALCPRYFTEEEDGLTQWWEGQVWVNPPYGSKENPAWAKKIAGAVREDATLVAALVPVATETRWWQHHIFTAHEIYFITPRLRFNGTKSGGTFASALAVWYADASHPPRFGLMDDKARVLSWPCDDSGPVAEPCSDLGGSS